jgi:DNA-binding beta-propeller fold protein YncE
MSRTQTFECPNCGGSLDYDGGNEHTIKCAYCSTSVIVPKELRDDAAPSVQQINLSFGTQLQSSGQKQSSSLGCIISIVIIAVVIAAIAIPIYLLENPDNNVLGTSSQSYANVTLSFGSEGIGQGMFTDARSVGVDGEGNIYVAEYSDGRVQVFDSSGEFIALWNLEGDDIYLTGMDVTRDGTLLAVYKGTIHRYDGMSGELLGTVSYSDDSFEDVMVAADGGLITSWNHFDDNIIRFDKNGDVDLTITEAISGQTGDNELSMYVAVDGLGNIYALGAFNEAVFKFSPEGQYLNRFGGDGDEPGLFTAAGAITVDGQGRVYVADFKGVQVFDADGRYIDLIKVQGAASGMAFNDDNQLLVVARDEVFVYTLKNP